MKKYDYTHTGVEESNAPLRVLCVSIYREMHELVKEYANELEVPVDIVDGGFYYGGDLRAQELQNNYDVIISLAGTAFCIQKLVSIPVIAIEVTIRDFITGLKKALSYDLPLVLLYYRDEYFSEMETIARSFTRRKVTAFSYSNREEYVIAMEHIMLMKNHVIVGIGTCVMKIMNKFTIEYIMICAAKEQIYQAVISAKLIIDQKMHEKLRSERLSNIVNYSREGILSIDHNHRITICNPPARKLLNLTQTSPVGMDITSITAPTTLRKLCGSGSFLTNSLMKIGDKNLLVSRIPVHVRSQHRETVVTFQEVGQLLQMGADARVQLAQKGLVAKYDFCDILGRSPLLQESIRKAQGYAATEATILITGETGTGKELFAQSIHRASKRKDGPFVAINCAALPEQLLENELFGHEEGAFTGARRGGKPGLFEMAHKGTIFLDEIGELSLTTQGRLLRVLQEKELFRVGGSRIIAVDVRVVAATNRNMSALMDIGQFRRDLFFRINILPLPLAPLRWRIEDIPLLVNYFLRKSSERYGKSLFHLRNALPVEFQNYSWPGNVRELEHIIERLVVLHTPNGNPDALLTSIINEHSIIHSEIQSKTTIDDEITIPRGTMHDMELNILKKMLALHNNNQTRLASELGLSRVTVWKKLKCLGVECPRPKGGVVV